MTTYEKKMVKRNILTLALAVLITGTITGTCMYIRDIHKEDKMTKEELVTLSRQAMLDKPYLSMHIEISEEDIETILPIGHYQIQKERDTSKTQYYFTSGLDEEGNYDSINQFWEESETEPGMYDVYIWDSSLLEFVKTSVDYEPVSITAWDMLDNISDYELNEDLEQWGTDENDLCYVLTITGSNSEYEQVVEAIYINAESYLPEGILTLGSNPDGDSFEDGDTSYETLLFTNVRYSFNWYSEDACGVQIPKEYLTEQEYLEMVD